MGNRWIGLILAGAALVAFLLSSGTNWNISILVFNILLGVGVVIVAYWVDQDEKEIERTYISMKIEVDTLKSELEKLKKTRNGAEAGTTT